MEAYKNMTTRKFLYIATIFSLTLFLGTIPFISATSLELSFTTIKTVEVSNDGFDIWVDESIEICYISCGYSGIKSFDVSDPENPSLLDEIAESSGYAHQFYYLNGILYIGDGYGGLRIINGSDPDSLEEISQTNQYYGWNTQIDLENEICYLGSGFFTGHEYLIAYNISNPALPTEISKIGLPGYATDIELHNNTIFATHGNGFSIINVTNPNKMNIISEYIRAETATGDIIADNLVRVGNLIVIAYWDAATECVNVSDLENPVLIDHLSDVTHGFSLNLHDDLVYVFDHELGVIVYQISNAGEFQKVGEIPNIDNPSEMYIYQDYIYILDQSGTLHILEEIPIDENTNKIGGYTMKMLVAGNIMGICVIILIKRGKKT